MVRVVTPPADETNAPAFREIGSCCSAIGHLRARPGSRPYCPRRYRNYWCGLRLADNLQMARSERFRTPDPRNRNPMLYPAELRVPVARPIIRLVRAGPAAERLVTGVPAALADVGGRALAAIVGRGAVIIGKSAGLGAGPVIVLVADRVGQRPVMPVVPVWRASARLGARAAAAKRAAAIKNLALGILILRKIPPGN